MDESAQAGDLQETGTLKLWSVTKYCAKKQGVGLIENNNLEIKATLSEADGQANLFQRSLNTNQPIGGC